MASEKISLGIGELSTPTVLGLILNSVILIHGEA
jgi:hypothetical protein